MHTHGVHRRRRRIASPMSATMGEESNSRWTDLVASITRPSRASDVDGLLFASCPFPLQLGNPRLLEWLDRRLACGAPLCSIKCSRGQCLGLQTASLHVDLDGVLVTPYWTTLWAFAWRQLSEENLLCYPIVVHANNVANPAELCCQ